jgi:filamentous hemagglutinin family protein
MSPRIRNLLMTTTALLALGSLPSAAGPDGPAVVGGSATVTGQGTSSVIVNQMTDRAVINWTTFNIGANETTRFNQPNSSSVILNRVTGGLGPSMIEGTLTANGRVFVINRDGMLFGPNAVINTAGFLATTNDIKNSDFMAGRYDFGIAGRSDASIVNQGHITATSGGFAALVAPGVRNTGTISATLGTVSLASGNMFTLDLYGDRLIQLGVNDQIAAQVRDVATGQPLTSLVSNEGRLRANGGRVELTAAAARQVVDSVINNKGVIEANSVGQRNGMIVIGAATEASKPAGAPKQTVKISGTLSAAGKRQNTNGGTIVVTGEDIKVANAQIDASGRAGGGKVMIGGDWGGGRPTLGLVNNPSARLESAPIATATTVSIDATTTIDASAKDSGNGGKVILWSDSQTTFAGTIFARGGSLAGDGGFVETSSHGQLVFAGSVDTRAPNGAAGTLLLDPYDVTISNGTTNSGNFSGGTWTPNNNGSTIKASDLVAQLGLGNVIVTTNGSGTEAGNINVNANVTWGNNSTLTLSAFHDINIAAGVTIANTASGSLVLRADSTGIGSGTVRFPFSSCDCANPPPLGVIDFSQSTGTVSIYYDPTQPLSVAGINKYQNPTDFSSHVMQAFSGQLTTYMLVNNVSDLALIGTDNGTLSRTYALGRDFSATGFTGFGPGTTFTGLLEGNGGLGTNYTISNLTLSSSTSPVGLFGFIGTGATVRNLNLANVSITGTHDTMFLGTLAGQNNGTISNVNVTNSTVNGGTHEGIGAGGLVGQNTGTITNSNVTNVTVTVGNGCFVDCNGGTNFAGGLVGSNLGTITGSSATGTVSAGDYSLAGGLVGQNGLFPSQFTGAITSSFANVNVTVSGIESSAGGLVGQNNPGSTITNSQAIGAVAATTTVAGQMQFADAGGLVGQNAGTITSTTQPVQSSVCAQGASFSCAAGAVSVGAHGTAGGLVGFNQGTIQMSFASGAVTGLAGLPPLGNNDNEGRDTHLGGLVGGNLGTITDSHATGDVGTIDVAHLTVGGLVSDNSGTILRSFATGNVRAGDNSSAGGLVGDNNVSDCCFNNFGTGANNDARIADSHAAGSVTVGAFSIAGGLVASSGGIITNSTATGGLTGVTAGGDSILGGLVGVLGPESTALTQANVSVAVNGLGANSIIGGLIGLNLATITSSTASGPVNGTSDSYIGGLVGMNLGRIELSQVPAAMVVTGTGGFNLIGGLAGANIGTITTSSSAATVNSGFGSSVGGLVGANIALLDVPPQFVIPNSSFPVGTISNSSATGAVTGGIGSSVGGLVGDNGGSIMASTASGNVSGGSGSQVGGFVGSNAGPFAIPAIPGAIPAQCQEGFCQALAAATVSTEGGTIANSSATGAVTGDIASLVGGFAGSNPGTISNSFATGDVNGGLGSVLGGFVGLNFGGTGGGDDYGIITGSHATGQVTGLESTIGGGFFGVNALGTIERSYATGAVNGGPGSILGGFGAINLGTVNQSYASGAVTGGDNSTAGGFVALNVGFTDPDLGIAAGTISQSYALGAVTGGQNSLVGGFAAINAGTIDQTYAVGHVSAGTGSALGGLVASNGFAGFVPPDVTLPPGFTPPPGTVTNSYWDTQTTGQNTSAAGTGLTTAQMRDLSNFAGFDFQNVWAPPSEAAQSSDHQAHYPELYALSHVLWVQSANVSRVYGDAPPLLAQTGIFGFRTDLGDTASIANGLTLSTAATQTSNVGTYAITVNGSAISHDNTTYRIVSTGELTVTPRPLTITANPQSRTYGNINPALTFGIGGAGLVNGDTLAGALATTATTASNVGSYPITQGTLTASSNYAVNFVGANLVVDPRPLTITANNANKIYGNTLTFAGTEFNASGLVNGDTVNTVTLASAGAAATAQVAGGPFPIVASNAVGTGLANYAVNYVNGTLTLAPRPLTITANDTAKDEGKTLTFAGTEFQVTGLVNGDTVNTVTLTSPGAASTAAAVNSPFPIVPSNAAGTGLSNYSIAFTNGVLTVNPNPQQPPPLLQFVQASNQFLNPPITPPVVNTQLPPPPPPPPSQPPAPPLTTPPSGGVPGFPGATPFVQNKFFIVPPLNETRLIPNEAVLQVGSDVSLDAVRILLANLGFTILDIQGLGGLGTTTIRINTNNLTVAQAMPLIARLGLVAAATANYTYALTQDPAARSSEDVQGDAGQYVLGKLRLSDVHRVLKGTNISIGVIDSEIDGSHPDLEGVISGRFDATGVEEKPHPHGTGMAGAIASHRKLLGIAPGARLLAIRAFSSKASSAESTTFNILKGLDYAINNGVRIINMSFAGPRDPTLERAFKVAHDKGIVLIAAAGNAGPKSPPLYPAADKSVIGVTATDIDDKLFSGANRGNYIAIAAPGVDILVPAPENTYQMTTGTSVATAHISGIVALLLERNPKLTPDEIRKILTASAKRLGPNNEFGAGLVDPAKALQLAAPKTAAAPGAR